ncbi:MAG: cupredoxin domain-containing protein [Acidimicrobiales bacterium]
MVKRVSTTLAICAIAGGVAVVGLARPGFDTATETAAATEVATHTETAAETATENTAAPADTGQPAVITIEGFAFGGTTVARAGETVSVQNNDSAPHTVTDRNGAFDSGTLGGGESGTFTLPAEPGTYEFFCAIHPSMTAAITVEA